jgi:quercetin dioxygenase-like cupin family protein
MTDPAVFISPPRSGETYAAVGDIYTIRARGSDTGGTLCLVESRVGPGGGPPPHVHERDDETFYVLEGEVSFFTAKGRTVAGPGTLVHLPKGVPHAFKNEGPREARMLIWCTPAGFDRMVEAMGVKVSGPDAAAIVPTQEHIEHVMKVCPAFGIRFVDKL